MSDLTVHTDEVLVSLMKEGSQAAFTVLYERYWKKLVVQAYYILKTGEGAEEVVQEVFLDIWNRRAALQITYTFHTYIAAAIKYKILRWLSKEKKEQQRRALWTTAEEDTATQEWIDFQAMRSSLEAAVQQLPDKCQLVFRLSREAGMTEKEIARELDISIKTVETHLSRALKSLRTAYRHFLFFFL